MYIELLCIGVTSVAFLVAYLGEAARVLSFKHIKYSSDSESEESCCTKLVRWCDIGRIPCCVFR